jgi:hypothetical protein
LGASFASLAAQISVQREAPAQLTSDWRGGAALAALVRAEKNLQQQLQLQMGLQAMQLVLKTGSGQLSALRTHILGTAGHATALAKDNVVTLLCAYAPTGSGGFAVRGERRDVTDHRGKQIIVDAPLPPGALS